jgi:hypothetical protein
MRQDGARSRTSVVFCPSDGDQCATRRENGASPCSVLRRRGDQLTRRREPHIPYDELRSEARGDVWRYDERDGRQRAREFGPGASGHARRCRGARPGSNILRELEGSRARIVRAQRRASARNAARRRCVTTSRAGVTSRAGGSEPCELCPGLEREISDARARAWRPRSRRAPPARPNAGMAHWSARVQGARGAR